MIVQSHGYFDLLHYGHLKHFEAASRLCFDIKGNRTGELIVTLTAARFMTKPGHPIFTDEQRVEMLMAWVGVVDRVKVIDSPGPYAAIDLVGPDIYVKGLEYEGRLPELQYCLDRGIKVMFLGEKIFGSTKLLSSLSAEMKDDELRFLRDKLKQGDYDGCDIMAAWIAIDELMQAKAALRLGYEDI